MRNYGFNFYFFLGFTLRNKLRASERTTLAELGKIIGQWPREVVNINQNVAGEGKGEQVGLAEFFYFADNYDKTD